MSTAIKTYEGTLNEDALRSMLEELEHGGDLIAVQPVLGPREAAPQHVDLHQIAELLLGLRLRGVELRYRISGREWCTSIRCCPDGFRMVRTAA